MYMYMHYTVHVYLCIVGDKYNFLLCVCEEVFQHGTEYLQLATVMCALISG